MDVTENKLNDGRVDRKEKILNVPHKLQINNYLLSVPSGKDSESA